MSQIGFKCPNCLISLSNIFFETHCIVHFIPALHHIFKNQLNPPCHRSHRQLYGGVLCGGVLCGGVLCVEVLYGGVLLGEVVCRGVLSEGVLCKGMF